MVIRQDTKEDALNISFKKLGIETEIILVNLSKILLWTYIFLFFYDKFYGHSIK